MQCKSYFFNFTISANFMDDNLLIYEIQPGDSLLSIGTKVGMSDAELRDFHNVNCHKAGLLWINGLTGISKIVIPKYYKSPQEIKEEKKKFLPAEQWTPDFLHPSYLITETIKEADDKKVQISYQTDLQIIRNPQKGLVAEIRNHSYKKDGNPVDDKMGGLAIAAIGSISPVPFLMTEEGKFAGISDPKEILNKFRNKRPDIEEFYIGEVTKNYLDRFEENIEIEDYFFRQLASAMQYRLLFPDVTLFHKSGTFERKFSVYRNSFPVNCRFSVSHNFENEELAETTFIGKIEESCSLQEVLRGVRFDPEPEEMLDGEVNIRFITSKSDKKLLKANLEIILRFEEENYVEHHLKIAKK